MQTQQVFSDVGNQPTIDPSTLTNEEIVALIKRLAIVLRDRTASEIAEIKRKKELVDAKLQEMRQRLYKARAEANKHLNEFLVKIASDPEFSSIVKIDKNGAIRIPSSVIKELGGITETDEVKRLQRMVDAILTASENYREQLKALGYGTVNIHEDHIYIRLSPRSNKRESKAETIERFKQMYLAMQKQNTPEVPNEIKEDIKNL